ncbi:MAG: glycosyltransferase family 4 protein, partial [Pyrobaculum sp.]
KFPLSLYWKIYQKLLPYVARDNPFRWADVVLANSRWTAGVAKMVYGEAPRVLNPPIPPTTEVVQKPKTFDERKPAVVMLGRFSQEKRYHWVVTELAPKLARELPEVEIHIYGSATTPTLRQYYQHVRKLAEKAGVAKHVFFTPNAPRQEINKAMDDARAFLHATINEHWGIVAVEAMARGLPIVIHKSGGVWTDVAEQGERGLGYTTAEEAVEQIAKLMTDAKLWRQLSQKGMEKARELTLEKFVENLAKALNLPEKT